MNDEFEGIDFFANDEDLNPVGDTGIDFFANDEDLNPVSQETEIDFFAGDDDLSTAQVAHTAPNLSTEQEDTGPTFEDYGRALMAGGPAVTGGLGWLMEKAGMDTIGGYLREVSKESLEQWQSGLTDEARAEMSKKFVTQDKDGEYHLGDATWDTVGLSLANSLLGTAAGMGAGLGIAKGLQLVPKITPMIAGVLGMGSGEALVGASSTGLATEEEVMAMSFEKLAAHPEYQAALLGTKDPARAREQVAKAAGGEAGAITALTTFIMSAPMGMFVGKMLGGKAVAKTRAGAIGLGAAGEGAQEFGQSGAEAIASNVAVQRHADEARKATEDALNSAIAGTAAGTIMGGGLGIAAPTAGQELANEMNRMVDIAEFEGTAEELARKSFNPEYAAMSVTKDLEKVNTVDEISAYADKAVSTILGEETPDPTASDFLNEQDQSDLPIAEPVQDPVQVNNRAALVESGVPEHVANNIEGYREHVGIKERVEPVAKEKPADQPSHEEIGSQFKEQIDSDFEGAVEQYNKLPDSKGGKVVNTDTARELNAHYMEDRTLAPAVHVTSSQFTKDLYTERLTQPAQEGEDEAVMFTAGGAGSGKTSAMEQFDSTDRYHTVVDTTMAKYKTGKAKIEQALAAGKEANIVMVTRDPVESLVVGALPRAVRMEAEFGSGRVVPLDAHLSTHKDAVATVIRLAEEYKDDPRVQISVLDNNHGKDNAQESSIDALKEIEYTNIEDNLLNALEKEYAEGRISTPIYLATKGEAAGISQDIQGRGAAKGDSQADVKVTEQLGQAEVGEAHVQEAGKESVPSTEKDLLQHGKRPTGDTGTEGTGAAKGVRSEGQEEGRVESKGQEALPKVEGKGKALNKIRVSEDRETEDGATVMVSRKADVVMKEIDERIDQMKALARCLRG